MACLQHASCTCFDSWMLSESRHDLLEYKYVIRNPDGEVVAWKPGPNYHLTVHQLQNSSQFAVSDTWDGSMHDIQVGSRAQSLEGQGAEGKRVRAVRKATKSGQKSDGL